MRDTPLNNFISSIEHLDISEDIIIIHSRMIPFKIRSSDVKNICEELLQFLGKDKTIIMPAFTYSFSRKKSWHYHKSKSEAGVLTEFFRQNIAESRTIHPVHSVSIFNNKYNLTHQSDSSFGQGSIWEFLCKNNVCNLSIGIGLHGGGTICHYPEEFNNVYYREFINLDGKVFDKNNELVKKKFKYFTRKRSLNIENSWNKCETDLIKNSILNIKFYKNIPVCTMNTKKASEFIIKKLLIDKNYLLKN